MANVELQLLSNIIRDGDLTSVRRHSFNATMFQTEEARELFRWIKDEFDRPDGGIVPSLEKVRRRFPNFEFCPVRDTTASLIAEVMAENTAIGMRLIIEEADQLLHSGEDPALVLSSMLPDLRDLSLLALGNHQHTIATSSASLREDYIRMQSSGGITGIPYPWNPMNSATAGMQPEELLIIYGRPKNMKSWIALAIATYAYVRGYRVFIYSAEMSVQQMMRRVASILAQVDYDELKRGALQPEDEERYFAILADLQEIERNMAAENGGKRPSISFMSDKDMKDAKGGATVDHLSVEIERFEADLALVDGFYLMRDARTGVRARDWKQVSNISSDLKAMARQLSIPVLATTQANRSANKTQGEDLEEIGYSDAIGQDADAVFRVFKGMTPMGSARRHPVVLITAPGVRDSVISPFVVNAWPGKDFSLYQTSVNVKSFLEDKKQTDKDDENENASAAAGGGGKGGSPGQGGRPRGGLGGVR